MEHDSPQPVKKKERGAEYLRVSTEEQNSEGHYGLQVQEERVKSWCESQGYVVAEGNIYKDEISGGLPVEKRPGLSALFEAAKRGEFDVVVVYKTGRLARNLRILVNIIHELDSLGVAFRSVTEPFDTTTSFGKASFNLVGTFAELEKEMIRERTTNGRIKAAKSGKWVGSTAPFGYVVNKTSRRLDINLQEAKIVKQIFKWAVDDKLAVHEIERRLNAMKVPAPWSTKIKTKETHNIWRPFTVRRVLANETHTGTFYYRKYKKPFNGLTSVTDPTRLRPKEDWIEQHCEPIITVEMYEAAKRQLTHNREFAKRNCKREYLFSKIIWCSQCKHKMFGGFQPARELGAHEGGRYYHGTYRKDDALGKTARCQWCPNYSEARLEPIWDFLRDILKNPKNMTRPLEKYIYKESDPLPVKQRLHDIAQELDTIRKRRDRVDDLYVSEQIDKQKYKSYQAEFKLDEQRLKDEDVRLRQTLLSKKEITDRQKAVAKAYEQIKDRLDKVSYEEKAKIVSYFVERVVLHAKDDHVEVAFKFPLDAETKEGKSFPLVHKIPTITEKERRATLMQSNPEMFTPKVLV